MEQTRILIIEDDNQLRTILRNILETAGYNDIEEAANGSIGVKLFRQHSFDLVITDIVMPDKEGLETITELIRDNPRTKIIAMSGGGRTGTQDYLKMAKSLGARRTLAKPFEYSDLVDAVQELLNE
jgi:YesN/AraC family two-component response regulator